MADIDVSKIKLPGDNNDYILKDATARADAPKVTQTNTTDTAEYRVLLSNSANDNEETAIVKKTGDLTFSRGAGILNLIGYGANETRINISHSNDINTNYDSVIMLHSFYTGNNRVYRGYTYFKTGMYHSTISVTFVGNDHPNLYKDVLKVTKNQSNEIVLDSCLIKEYIDAYEVETSGSITKNSTYINTVERNGWYKVGRAVMFWLTATAKTTWTSTCQICSGLPAPAVGFRFIGQLAVSGNNVPLRLEMDTTGKIKNGYSITNPTAGQTIEFSGCYIAAT